MIGLVLHVGSNSVQAFSLPGRTIGLTFIRYLSFLFPASN